MLDQLAAVSSSVSSAGRIVQPNSRLASLWFDGQLRHYTDDLVAAAAQITTLIESILISR